MRFIANIRLGKKDRDVKTYEFSAADINEAREWGERQATELGLTPKSVDVMRSTSNTDAEQTK